jgi:hypothetical protein
LREYERERVRESERERKSGRSEALKIASYKQQEKEGLLCFEVYFFN